MKYRIGYSRDLAPLLSYNSTSGCGIQIVSFLNKDFSHTNSIAAQTKAHDIPIQFCASSNYLDKDIFKYHVAFQANRTHMFFLPKTYVQQNTNAMNKINFSEDSNEFIKSTMI